MWLTGLVAPRHVGSSQTRARTRVPCIGRQILNHCATREARCCFLMPVTPLSLQVSTLSKLTPSLSPSAPHPLHSPVAGSTPLHTRPMTPISTPETYTLSPTPLLGTSSEEILPPAPAPKAQGMTLGKSALCFSGCKQPFREHSSCLGLTPISS